LTLPVLAAALGVATGVPLIRCLWCLAGLIRLFPNHARADRSEWGWLQLTIAPEAYVLSAARRATHVRRVSCTKEAEPRPVAPGTQNGESLPGCIPGSRRTGTLSH
jgi:hypothetical protein